LASRGWLMTPLPVVYLFSVIVGAIAFVLILDFARIPVFNRLQIE
jgi:hypothetical protein